MQAPFAGTKGWYKGVCGVASQVLTMAPSGLWGEESWVGGWRKAPGGQGRAPRLRVSLTTAPAPPGLLSASPLFGSSFFFVQSCSNVAVPAPCILAVNQNGLSFLSTETHVSGLMWPCIPPPQETSLTPAGLWARPLPRPHLPGGGWCSCERR